MPNTGPSALEQEIDRLYSLPLSQFIAARDSLAAGLRKEKRREEAIRVKKLAKPSLAAWAVNQLYWKRRPLWDALIRAGEALREAVGRSAEQSRPAEQRRRAQAKLLSEAEGILAEGGHAPAAATLEKIHHTLEAVSVYGEALPGDPPGRLSRPLDPPGFEALFSLAASMPPPSRRTSRSKAPARESAPPAKPSAEPPTPSPRARARLAKAERELARCRREAQQAAVRAEDLGQKLARIGTEVEEAEQRLERVRLRLEEAAAHEKKAREEAAAAAAALAEAEQIRQAALDELNS